MVKILIVDDEVFTRDGIEENMNWEELGISSVSKARDGVHALEVAENLLPDILLTDVRMPRMDGIELAFKIREMLPKSKIIFMSGYSDKEYLISAIALKAIRYVEKPIDHDDIHQAIHEAVNMCKEERKKQENEIELDSRYRVSIAEIRNTVALELTRMNTDVTYIRKRLKNADLEIPVYSDIKTILFRLLEKNGSPVENPTIIRSQIEDWINQVLAQNSLKAMTSFKDREYIVVHVYSINKGQNLLKRKIIEDFCIQLANRMSDHFRLFASIGSTVRQILHIYQSYQTAATAMQTCFFKHYNTVVFYEDINNLTYTFSDELISKFLRLIADEEESRAILFIQSLSLDISRHDQTPINYVKDVYYRLLSNLRKIAEDRGIYFPSSHNDNEFIWESLYQFNVLSEIELYCVEQVKSYFLSIHQLRTTNDVVGNALQFINKNYIHADLSIQDISQYTGFSVSYISIILKEKTGKTVNQHITEYRIEKAKEFLKDPRQKVFDIAAKVGYSDGNYFAKIFRKVTGITPSEYRKRYLG